jgi:chemotaxis signal transduction protein
MDYEHDDRRAADVPGATGAEGSGLPAGREPLDAGLPSSRSPEVRAFDPHLGSGPGPSDLTASGQADDLFDAMFLTGGLRPPAFAAVDHDLGFPPPPAPDLASAFLAALDAIDDRRFVTPVPDEPPAAPNAPVETAAPLEMTATGEPAYELRPQSRLELESEGTPGPVDETPAPAEHVAAEGVERLPWDTGRAPVAGLLTSGEISGAIADGREAEPEREAEAAPEPAAAPATQATESADDTWAFASYLESESDLQARAAMRTLEENNAAEAEGVEEFATTASVEDAEPIEEAAYFDAGLDGDAGDSDDAEAAAIAAAEADAEAEAVAVAAAAEADAAAEGDADGEAVAAQAAADAEAAAETEAAEAAAAAAAEAEAIAEAEVLAALALAEAEQAELEAAIAAEAALDEASTEASAGSYGASAAFGDASDEAADEAAEDASLVDDDAFDMAFDAAALAATPDADAVSAAPFDAGLMTPGDEDLELEPSIGMEPMDAAPMAFDGPDAFAPAAAAEPEPEPEPESDELEDLQDFVVFSLGDMRCVVPIRNVVEVGRIPDAAPVPNAPAWLYGLGNLRGQVLSLIDLRAFFGVGRIKASAGRMVVLRGDSDDITAGVMVDQVHQIVALSPSRFKEAPAALPLPEKTTEFVWGACDYGNYTMIGLDVDGVLGVESLTEEAV